MEVSVIKKLEVNKDDDYFELEVGEYATIFLKDGCCYCVEIIEIRETELLVIDEDGEKRTFPFSDMEDIIEG